MCQPPAREFSFFNCSLNLLSLIFIKRDCMVLFHCNSLAINTQRKEQQQWQKWGHKSVVWCITACDRLAQSLTQRKQIYVIPAELNDYILTGRNALLNPHFSQPDGGTLTLVSSDQIKRTETRPSHESLQGWYSVRTDTVNTWRLDLAVLFLK